MGGGWASSLLTIASRLPRILHLAEMQKAQARSDLRFFSDSS
jgi:hypothetical protein